MSVTWSDEVQSVFAGDLVTVSAYVTPAGGAIAVPVSPIGLVDRDAGQIAMTSSLAFPAKIKRLLEDPRVAMAYHTREHGFATSSRFVLAQGLATVPAEPAPERLATMTSQAAKFFGDIPAGPFWTWALREYLEYRLIIDIPVTRIMSWPTPDATGEPEVSGAGPAGPAAPQDPPAKGTGPRVDLAKFVRPAGKMPHQVIAFRGADGFPVIVPVRVTGHSDRGLHLDVAPGLLPPGGRRAGFAAHAFRPQAAGVSNRVGTGWLEVTDGTAVWAPHTAGGFTSPPSKTFHLLGNGLLSKYLIGKVRRAGALDELARLRAEARPAAGPTA